MGRDHQRYSKRNGHRLVVGCIPYKFPNEKTGNISDIDQLKVLVISSQKGNNLLFPKGGWEIGETKKKAACRETLEEAGVLGNIKGARLGKWTFKSRSHEAFKQGTMFALHVTKELDQWHEMDFRRREWVTVEKAKEGCPHLWMRKALDKLINRFSNPINGEKLAIRPDYVAETMLSQ